MADEITIEEIVINSNIETIFDKIAGGKAADNNTAGERVEELTIDPSVELAVLEAAERVDEIFVDPSIEAILEAAERIDEEVKGPRFESSPQ